MKSLITTQKKVLFSSLFLFASLSILCAQSYKLDNKTSFLQVNGTSSLHDWHVDAERQSGILEFSNIDEGAIKSIKFSVESESLKSGKSGMDKNTYKALKTKSFKTIDFSLTKIISVNELSEGHYNVKAEGKLLICGVSKVIPMDFELIIKNESAQIIGKNTLLMTDYGIEPPRALLGTIKTGDEIVISYKTVFK
ncbi:YceI-like domain-containing protein [Winogradskyella wandonensis]|uniref:YceI-like domain-containing protein n=1 Tax=Winogradskyella wandonensis TaxID=1442586 RepID=A0A4R1KNP9_9FLAO|nr:YceI family protein [Winogradskyella wandonensis]TCK66684.1 YceI-like domain-containing protein [Winogradskyella wandonensis]